MSISKDLLEFARTRPAWQRDLLRRICAQSELTDEDLRQVLAMLKSTEGLEAGATPTQDLETNHFASRPSPSHSEVRLTSIDCVNGVNRLARDQTLLFGTEGITLIYGYNGSGKTGYSRILKSACRSRDDSPARILANVYESSAQRKATARIGYLTNGVLQTFLWKDGEPSPAELRQISVFDSTTAPLYADQRNRIEFLPFGLDVLPQMASACGLLSASIEEEINDIGTELSVSLPSVKSAHFAELLSRFQPNGLRILSREEIEREFRWSEGDDSEVAALEEAILNLSEPARKSAQLSRLKRSLEILKAKVDPCVSFFSEAGVMTHIGLVADAESARRAATIAAEGRFSNDPLGEATTSDAWRRLFKCAEDFNAVAYPGEEFPATGTDRVCLLCQRPLDEASSERLIRFKTFVADQTQQAAVEAEQRLDRAIRGLDVMAVPSDEDIEQCFAELVEVRAKCDLLRSKTEQCRKEILALRSETIAFLKGNGSLELIGPLDLTKVPDFGSEISELDQELEATKALVSDDPRLTRLRVKHTEMLDRKVCASQLEHLLKRNENLKKVWALTRCKEQCDTSSISRIATTLREKYLTEDFQNKIRAEVEYLQGREVVVFQRAITLSRYFCESIAIAPPAL